MNLEGISLGPKGLGGKAVFTNPVLSASHLGYVQITPTLTPATVYSNAPSTDKKLLTWRWVKMKVGPFF